MLPRSRGSSAIRILNYNITFIHHHLDYIFHLCIIIYVSRLF